MGWIKMRTDLATDPRIVQMSVLMGLPRAQIIGCCHALWSLADQHTADGHLVGYTHLVIDQLVEASGFASACEMVGWLEQTEEGVRIVRFDDHNSSTAKSRAQAAARSSRYRHADSVMRREPTTEKNKRKQQQQQTEDGAAVVETNSEWIKAAENLAKRPEWLPSSKAWISRETWLELFRANPSLPIDDFRRLLDHVRRSANRLDNPSGLLIKLLKERGVVTTSQNVSDSVKQ